jgi:hypothetical protein
VAQDGVAQLGVELGHPLRHRPVRLGDQLLELDARQVMAADPVRVVVDQRQFLDDPVQAWRDGEVSGHLRPSGP